MLNSDEERLMREQIADLQEAEGQQFLEQLIEVLCFCWRYRCLQI